MEAKNSKYAEGFRNIAQSFKSECHKDTQIVCIIAFLQINLLKKS